MKVLFVGDAAVSTGFARCTHAACDALHQAGHEVIVLGLNYFGDPHPYPYPIYPCRQPLAGGRDIFGVTRLPLMVQDHEPDLIVLLQDPWNVPGYFDYADAQGVDLPPVLGWLAVDAKNQHGECLERLSDVVVWTEFAAAELHRAGMAEGIECDPVVIPLGVDSMRFRPMDRALARATVGINNVIPLHEDAFIIGVVGRNQPRKRLDLTLEYFAAWLDKSARQDAYLYLHVAPTGERACDLKRLIAYYGLSGRVLLSKPLNTGKGVDEDLLRAIYNSFDVYWTTTQGEGWGLPCLEAMACGVPCVVPDYSGLGSWVSDAALRVPCTASALTAPLNGRPYTIGGVVDKAGSLQALDAIYGSQDLRTRLARRGRELALSMPWLATGHCMVGACENAAGDPETIAEGDRAGQEETAALGHSPAVQGVEHGHP